MGILINVLLTIWGLIAFLMMLVILMQRPKSEGLGAAFGGAVTENIFGAQTTNVLVKFTVWLASIFFILTFALSILYARKGTGDSELRRELMKQQSGAPAAPTPAAASPAGASAAAPTPQASPVSSPAPDSGVGVVPAGSATPAASPAASPAESPTAEPQASPAKRKRKP